MIRTHSTADSAFQPHGEAEAEQAYLNRHGIIDAVLTDDVDALVFGALRVIKNSSLTLSGNESNPALDSEGKPTLEAGAERNVQHARVMENRRGAEKCHHDASVVSSHSDSESSNNQHVPLLNLAKRPPDSPVSRETKRRAISNNFSATQHAAIPRGNTHEKNVQVRDPSMSEFERWSLAQRQRRKRERLQSQQPPTTGTPGSAAREREPTPGAMEVDELPPVHQHDHRPDGIDIDLPPQAANILEPVDNLHNHVPPAPLQFPAAIPPQQFVPPPCSPRSSSCTTAICRAKLASRSRQNGCCMPPL
ncbi:uncharacterized protein EDB91DRAFT_1246204 [Suillus paluster]|uniref:uncharacterized protein n=1 Tax=Suillus paluster TaxID=48578 RepID=UPI001B86ADD5|nr:uncharacterized protein EDB91DRAFT_1246204 [Suillus paluster]KAG1745347.1 hypothetical protein EDB91DRAFT_1246204 [Suillus paluster]